MTLSGWCSSPAGARPMHAFCRYGGCTCSCHPVNGDSKDDDE